MIFRPTIQVHKTVLDGFRRRAWRAYPNEYLESILGVITLAGFSINILSPVNHTGSRLVVNYDHDVEDLHDAEDDTKSQFLGYIHTHIGWRVCQHFSEEDHLDALNNKELLSGVCWIYRSGNKRHSEFYFEVPRPPLLLEISNQ